MIAVPGQGLGSPLADRLFVGVLVLGTVVAFVSGVLAYRGRWRSWYYNDHYPSRLPYWPLTMTWLSAAFLLMGLAVLVDAALKPISRPLILIIIPLSVICSVVTIFMIYPPVRFLPRWMREEEKERRKVKIPWSFVPPRGESKADKTTDD